MKTENEQLAEDFRDSELWWGDIPSNHINGKCSGCGKEINQNKPVSFLIDNAHGIEHYDYHVDCVKNRFAQTGIKKKIANRLQTENKPESSVIEFFN